MSARKRLGSTEERVSWGSTSSIAGALDGRRGSSQSTGRDTLKVGDTAHATASEAPLGLAAGTAIAPGVVPTLLGDNNAPSRPRKLSDIARVLSLQNSAPSVPSMAETNARAMKCLKDGDVAEAFKLCAEAKEALAAEEASLNAAVSSDVVDQQKRSVLRAHAETESILGICHKRSGSCIAAARSLQQALRLYKTAGSDLRTLIAAHLNLSSCLTELKSCGKALKHAQAAVGLAGRLVAGPELRELYGESSSGDMHSSDLEPRSDDYAMLAVAYHKVAEAQEGLKDWSAASFAFSQAYQVVQKSLGPEHRLTRSFEKSTRCPRNVVMVDHGGKVDHVADVAVPNPIGAGFFRTTSSNPDTPRRRLPDIPGNINGRSRFPLVNTQEYKLGPETFASWPPKDASCEEQHWYSVAQRHQRALNRKCQNAMAAPPSR
eukprot:TRINITY_DN38591_c0_g1_i1.p1 TRINITY_DN38591_c0_g1~~TRINITY_DN38591_c0_g1_i1.p1  ORF type:complete len:433 (-),score=53.22 TRINITY_DN38591_c0_g1_i1:74-1372(-)